MNSLLNRQLNKNNIKRTLQTSHDWNIARKTYQSIFDFNIVTFNLLAPCYKRLPTINPATGRRDRESSNQLLWKSRRNATLEFFSQNIFPIASVIALQEFWLDDGYKTKFTSELNKNGYELKSLPRAGMFSFVFSLTLFIGKY